MNPKQKAETEWRNIHKAEELHDQVVYAARLLRDSAQKAAHDELDALVLQYRTQALEKLALRGVTMLQGFSLIEPSDVKARIDGIGFWWHHTDGEGIAQFEVVKWEDLE
jgi:hypothetical protein